MAQKIMVVDNIPYAEGTFDTEKYKQIHDAILSYSITYIEIEGAIRSSKDVLALNCYAEFLMLTPDKYHLVTHVTMDAAKKTVYDADGFGLKYLIPHGKLYSVDNRDVFRFTDWNGMEKEVHFFGLSQYNDHEKFRGMNYGSHYANEATRQNVIGLKNARDRTIAAKWRKVIYTQNPISPSNSFYEEIEKPLIASDKQCAEIYALRDKFREEYGNIVNKYQLLENEIVKSTLKKYLQKFKKSSVNFLTQNEKLIIRKSILVNKYMNRQAREEELYNKYKITSKHFIFNEGGDNPNNIRNGLDFRYFHLVMENNLSLTQVRMEEAKAAYDVNSLHYKQDILGIRAMAEGAIYDNLSNDNYYYLELPNHLMKQGWARILAIDYGVMNDFVILDSYIEPKTKCLFVENEFRFKGASPNENRPATNELYIKFVKEMIASRENGAYTTLIYDPSARPFANTLSVNNIKSQRANNTVKRSRRVKKLDIENQDNRLFKENSGIMLVKDGIGMKKIMINKPKCKELVFELESYSFDDKKLKNGIEEPLKIRDHGCIIGNSKITTIKGKKKIQKVKKGDVLLTRNEQNGILEFDVVEDCRLTQKNADIYELKLRNGFKLRCTLDHKIFTLNGKIPLGDINNEIVVCLSKNSIDLEYSLIEYIKKVGKADVYNIQMKKNHNYFANNINISNCDALRYIVNTCIKSTSTWRNSQKEGVNLEYVEQKSQEISNESEGQLPIEEGFTTHRKNFNSF